MGDGSCISVEHGLPVQELMAQIDLHIPIETMSAQMKADEIGESI
jgi:hypothetical protein